MTSHRGGMAREHAHVIGGLRLYALEPVFEILKRHPVTPPDSAVQVSAFSASRRNASGTVGLSGWRLAQASSAANCGGWIRTRTGRPFPVGRGPRLPGRRLPDFTVCLAILTVISPDRPLINGT